MEIDLASLEPEHAYRLLVSCIVPRPIALVSTRGLDGSVNAAPFSFFNAISDEPPAVVIGVNSPYERVKDTAINIRDTGQFVVNLVSEKMAARMNSCALEYPYGHSEIEAAGLTAQPSRRVAPPRIAESPVSLECRRLVAVEIGLRRTAVIGEVLVVHVTEDAVDPNRIEIHGDRLNLIGRMHGSTYVRTTDRFEMRRPTNRR